MPEAQSVQSLFTGLDDSGITSVLGAIADYRDRISAAERQCVANAVDKRQREFSSGRWFARLAMAALDVPPAAVLSAADRAPQWPTTMLGSISHSDTLAWVVGARRAMSDLEGLGADLERLHRLQPEMNGKLFLPAERRRMEALAAAPDTALLDDLTGSAGSDRMQRLATLWFSAKEAVYKATAPIAGQFIGFQEVELVPNNAGTAFSMRYHGDHAPSAVMERGRGYLAIRQEHALALFLIPRI